MNRVLKTAAVIMIGIAQIPGAALADRRVLPDETREFRSPASKFRLRVVAVDQWSEPYVSAELYRVKERDCADELVWRIDRLPHRLGPSRALVTDGGRVLLVDEWVNTPSSLAIMVLDTNGKIKTTLSFRDIAKLSGNSEASLAESAKLGAWQSAEPSLVSGEERARLVTKRTPLCLDLVTGQVHLKCD